jgi:hypothetical protein
MLIDLNKHLGDNFIVVAVHRDKDSASADRKRWVVAFFPDDNSRPTSLATTRTYMTMLQRHNKDHHASQRWESRKIEFCLSENLINLALQ